MHQAVLPLWSPETAGPRALVLRLAPAAVRALRPPERGAVLDASTANLRTKTLDFRGFDSSRVLILTGGIIMPIGQIPESLSQAILVWIILVRRLGTMSKFTVLRRFLIACRKEAQNHFSPSSPTGLTVSPLLASGDGSSSSLRKLPSGCSAASRGAPSTQTARPRPSCPGPGGLASYRACLRPICMWHGHLFE